MNIYIENIENGRRVILKSGKTTVGKFSYKEIEDSFSLETSDKLDINDLIESAYQAGKEGRILIIREKA